MNAFEFLTQQEQTLRDKIKEDYKIMDDDIIVVAVIPNPDNINFKYKGLSKFRKYEIVVYGQTPAEVMVNLCVEYGHHCEYYLSQSSG